MLIEARAEDLHGQVAILVLGSFVLALNDDARGQVSEADCGFDFVDVLSAVAAGAESVDAKVFRLDDDFDAIVNFGDDEYGREGSVAARGLIKGRNADEAMHAGFAREKAEGVFTFDANGDGFEAGFFAES